MPQLFFLDTNIFVYTFDNSSPQKKEHCIDLVQKALTSCNGLISSQVVQEFCNLAMRKFVVPFSCSECHMYLDEVLLPLCRVYPSENLYHIAIQLCERYLLSWYDSLIVAAAVQAGCDIIYTEDLQHGMQISDVKICNPFINE
ncbi:MAG: PIN domain-containing protein [Deltaproteobacteria bacterium]|nr:PIN domain-containing protein [Deltaproteobacteria bacterium]